MNTESIAQRAGPTRVSVTAFVLCILLGRGWAVQQVGDIIMYIATWITISHLSVGAYFFIRLGAHSPAQRVLDGAAFCGVIVLAWWFTHPAIWCLALALVMVLAIAKYTLLYRADTRTAVRRYAREKIQWETPSVPFMAALAIAFTVLEAGTPIALYLRIAVLTATLLFAWWIGVVRRVYAHVAAGQPDASPTTS